MASTAQIAFNEMVVTMATRAILRNRAPLIALEDYDRETFAAWMRTDLNNLFKAMFGRKKKTKFPWEMALLQASEPVPADAKSITPLQAFFDDREFYQSMLVHYAPPAAALDTRDPTTTSVVGHWPLLDNTTEKALYKDARALLQTHVFRLLQELVASPFWQTLS